MKPNVVKRSAQNRAFSNKLPADLDAESAVLFVRTGVRWLSNGHTAYGALS